MKNPTQEFIQNNLRIEYGSGNMLRLRTKHFSIGQRSSNQTERLSEYLKEFKINFQELVEIIAARIAMSIFYLANWPVVIRHFIEMLKNVLVARPRFTCAISDSKKQKSFLMLEIIPLEI